MENMDKREIVSALADGQLAGEAFARGVEIASTDAAARQAWHAYHLIGDVLRSGDLAHAAPCDRFLARLQERLREEPAAAAQTPRAGVAGPAGTRAANDDSFRWKMVAGAASLAAVSAIAWTLIGSAPQRQSGAQIAASGPLPAGTVLAGSGRDAMIRDPHLDEFMATHRQFGGAALVAPAGYLRNATFDTPGR